MRDQILILLVGLVSLSGCAQVIPPKPDDPYYAPSIPLTEQQRVEQPQTGSLFSASNASFLYSDRTASRIGDLLTINLNESTNASKNADTEIKKADTNTLAPTISGRIPSYGGNPISFDLDSASKFKAESDSAQANSLDGTITVTVSQVLPNGNLMIKGEKWLTLNQGNEFIRITGMIRPEDISTDNTISSTRVANARITYSGTGALEDSNKKGWLSQFFSSSWFPL
ncbi:MAG: flagellar basal body L-ring protein FlgH [Gammaproteobacteria bacterium]|nr:flagellar basal body L-ring protein FlgH [Gammaproteobacteria bacterium]